VEGKEPGKKFNIIIPEIFKNRLFIIIAGAILFVALAGGVFSVYLLRDKVAADDSPTADKSTGAFTVSDEVSDVAEVLPQQMRDTGDESTSDLWTSFDAGVDPFTDPMKLTGVVVGGRGGAMAIIESSGTAYIVAVGDYVDDLWAVREITRDMVVMRAYNQEVSLFLDQPPITRTLDGGLFEEEDQEEGA
jgi:type II secretory pathway component PulC